MFIGRTDADAPEPLPLLAGETTVAPWVGHKNLDRLELCTGFMFDPDRSALEFWLFLLVAM